MALDPYEMAMAAQRAQMLSNIGEMRGAAGMPVDPAQRASALQGGIGAMQRRTPWQHMNPQQRAMVLSQMQPQQAAPEQAKPGMMLVGRGAQDALPFPMQTGQTQRIAPTGPLADRVRELAGRVEAERLKATSADRIARKQKIADTRESKRTANLAKWRAVGRLPEDPATQRQHQLALAALLSQRNRSSSNVNPLDELLAERLRNNPALLEAWQQGQVPGYTPPPTPEQPGTPIGPPEAPSPALTIGRRMMGMEQGPPLNLWEKFIGSLGRTQGGMGVPMY